MSQLMIIRHKFEANIRPVPLHYLGDGSCALRYETFPVGLCVGFR